jgi:hypothetical protein
MVEGLAAPCDKCGGEVTGVEEALTLTPPNCKVSRASLVELEGGEAGKGREGYLLERRTCECKQRCAKGDDSER